MTRLRCSISSSRRWMSGRRRSRTDRKAYGVTLAPYAIALGPPPPNVADIEHQRDVLIRCARLRSQALDKLNLVDYILDPRHSNEFEIVPPPEGPDLPGLQAALAGDLDVVADTASFAINNPTQACDPEEFMRTIRNAPGFRLTVLPANLPRQKETFPSPTILVPNLVGLIENDLFLARRCLPGSSVDACLAEVEQGSPSNMDRDGMTFMKAVVDGEVTLKHEPSIVGSHSASVVQGTVPVRWHLRATWHGGRASVRTCDLARAARRLLASSRAATTCLRSARAPRRQDQRVRSCLTVTAGG